MTIEPARDELLPALGCSGDVETPIAALKGHAKLISNGRVTLADCRQCVDPTCPERADLVLRCTPQAQPSISQGQPGSVQHFWCARDVQHLAKAIPHRGMVHCRKRFGLRRRENPQQVVRPGNGAEEQKKSRALQIAHWQDPVQKGGMFLVHAANFSLDVVKMSERSAQDADALLTRRQQLVASPHHHWWTGSRPCLHNVFATKGEHRFWPRPFWPAFFFPLLAPTAFGPDRFWPKPLLA